MLPVDKLIVLQDISLQLGTQHLPKQRIIKAAKHQTKYVQKLLFSFLDEA